MDIKSYICQLVISKKLLYILVYSYSDSSPRLYLIPVLCLFFLFHGEAGAQNVALKTNLPYAAAASANLGLEVGLAPRWTLDISGNYMPWKFYNGLLRKHAFVQPEARYWFCDRFSGHFIGVHAHSGLFNVTGSGVLADVPLINKVFDDLDQRRYQGWFAGAGSRGESDIPTSTMMSTNARNAVPCLKTATITMSA